MKTEEQKEYIAPQVKIVEVVVEKGFAMSSIIGKQQVMEKHEVDQTLNVW